MVILATVGTTGCGGAAGWLTFGGGVHLYMLSLIVLVVFNINLVSDGDLLERVFPIIVLVDDSFLAYRPVGAVYWAAAWCEPRNLEAVGGGAAWRSGSLRLPAWALPGSWNVAKVW
jgi:hypothetical protein